MVTGAGASLSVLLKLSYSLFLLTYIHTSSQLWVLTVERSPFCSPEIQPREGLWLENPSCSQEGLVLLLVYAGWDSRKETNQVTFIPLER